MPTYDYTYPTPYGGYCRILVYQTPDALPVVVCTEPKDNSGQSITNAAAVVAAGVLENHRTWSTPAPGMTSRSCGLNTTKAAPEGLPRTPLHSTL
jgi:hypothetical protein